MTPRPGIPLRADPFAIAELALSNIVRGVIAVAQSKLDGGNIKPREVAASRWGSDGAKEVELILRGASSPAMTTTTGWAKELAQSTTAFLAA